MINKDQADKLFGTWSSFMHPIINNHLNILQVLASRKKFFPTSMYNWFEAFKACPKDKCKVVIIGMSPYHSEGLAQGIAFSCHQMTPLLEVINNALVRELLPWNQQHQTLTVHDLRPWADQGVLLLNAALTCYPGKANSDIELWKPFMQEVVTKLTLLDSFIFLRWGRDAQNIEIDKMNNHVFDSYHPLAEKYNNKKKFFSNFKRANELITASNGKEYNIRWY